MLVIREFIVAGLIDTFLGTIFQAYIVYVAVSHHDPFKYLYFFALDILLLSVPSFWLAFKIKRATQLAKSFPIYLIVRLATSFWFYYAFVYVFVLRKSTRKFEKGRK